MKKLQANTLITQHGSQKLIDSLGPYVTDQRKQRIEAVLDGRLQGIQLAIEAPSDIHNALAAVRSSEALGITTVHIIAPQSEATHTRTITQGAFNWVDVVFHESIEDFLRILRQENWLLAGGCVTASCSIQKVPIERPLCLILGNEHRGLSESGRAACDTLYKIPMFGMTESFNLSVSAAISLYDTTQRKRHHLNANTDLDSHARQALQARYYINSLAPRLVNGLLSHVPNVISGLQM